ncbi:uncharacterized protein LOC116297650 [Actinia tenebrosa]|uniref:Uncharacterized protein LOC116297650 n=1 Tax=Actinia tenebrosa TaxID=6105 RepID=A0A6P8I9G5_ACTTE|nr:uncharacterized protein LOC116297650 [Actinia tenebrosa]
MILQAIEQRGRNWKSVLKFLCEHVDVLGKTGEFYKNVDVNDKRMQERIRKRAAKLLDGEKSQRMQLKTSIENEYYSAGDMDDDKQLHLAVGNENIDDELCEVAESIKQRDRKYVLNNQAAGSGSHVAQPKDVLNVIKRTAEKEKSEEQRKRKKAKKSSPTATVTSKMEALLDKLPQFLDTANKAAEAHSDAIEKWKKKNGLISDDSDE